MFRNIIIMFSLAFVFAGCAAKQAPQEDDGGWQAFRSSLDNYNNACADIALAKTKAKAAEAHALKVEGKEAESKKAKDEAMELFKMEEPEYQKINAANEAQLARHKEISSMLASMDAEYSKSKPAAWAPVKTQVEQYLAEAQKAYSKCDTNGMVMCLDMADNALKSFDGKTVIMEKSVTGVKYTVKKGDCLWVIAGRQYSNPFMWPLIYWSNKTQIKDPDLIFPGQNFEIVMQYSKDEQMKAENLSKTRGPWSLYDNK